MDQVLDLDDLTILLDKVQKEIEIQIINHNRRGELDHYLKQLPIEEDPIYRAEKERVGKILVIGDSRVRQRHLKGIVSSLNLDPHRFEFVMNYKDSKNYSFDSLAYNDHYEYVFVGPIPHKVKGLGADSSMISQMEKNPDIYPSVVRIMNEAGELKISKTSFKKALKENIL